MTFNQDFFDATVRRQIDLLRFGTGVARRVNKILEETHADLKALIQRKLSGGTQLDGRGVKRLSDLERAIDQRRSGAWNDVGELWNTTAVDVALDQSAFVGDTLTRLLPVKLDLIQPAERTLKALATSRPFEGKHLKEWAQSTERADLTRIKQQIRIGMVQGESAADIASRVFGARGAANVTRSQAEAVTRTVINHVSNVAQAEFLQDNADLFDQELFVATLDSRTTLVCAGNDGKRFPIGKGPRPPLHVNCRSIRVGTIDGEVIGERPFVAATEQQMLREYADQNGLGRVTERDQLPRGHKTRYEKFRRSRMRELTGQVPAHTSYQEWLKSQPSVFQDDVLGAARAKLFRDGGLTLDKFTHRDGDELTLDELRQRYKTAWERAGLDKVPAAPVRAAAGAPLARFAKLVETFGEVTPAHQSAAVRALTRMGAGLSDQVPKLERLMLTGLTGRGEGQLPLGTGGDYTPRQGRLRVGTNPETLSRFLRATDLVQVPGYTANLARDLDGVVEMAAAHEYAHHVHLSGLLSALNAGTRDEADSLIRHAFGSDDPQFVSRYAAYSAEEFWAESHVAYHYYPRDWMAARAPKVVALVERVLRLKGLL